MTNIILFDDKDTWTDLLPIVYTRPISDIRIGILTIKEKWQKYFPDHDFSCLTAEYLSVKYPTNITDDNLFIAGNCCPDKNFADAVSVLGNGEALAYNGELVAYRGTMEGFRSVNLEKAAPYTASSLTMLHQLYDIFLLNGSEMRRDYHIIIAGRESQPLSETCTIVGPYRLDDGCPAIFIEEGATVEAVTLNTTGGPIYIGKDAVIMEGVCIRAPFAACRHSQVNMGAKIYGATTLGPYCKVGGELNNVVMIGYSNKAHDGFLGDAVLGEWCNLGAGTNCSNLKNDYSEVKVWSYAQERFIKTGLQFCGLVMGDHSKSAIGTQFNTGTVVGVAANVFAAGFPKNYIPSFSWGKDTYRLERAMETAKIVYARRGKVFAEEDARILKSIYEQTETNRIRFGAN